MKDPRPVNGNIDEWGLEAIRYQIGRWLAGEHGANLATILAAQRGPDSPSERPDMSGKEFERAYWGRRARKASSGEIVRRASFYGIGEVGARSRAGTAIIVPCEAHWDHYDKHQVKAAKLLGLEVIRSAEAPSAIKAEWKGSRYE